MRIPSGDLAPARRGRRSRRRSGSGGYGPSRGLSSSRGLTYRARRRRPLRTLLLLLLVVGLGAGAATLLRQDDSKVPARLARADPRPSARATHATVTPTCRPSAALSLPAPGAVRLALRNGTTRNGLVRTVAGQLAARGFGVTASGNAAALVGASTVAYGPGAQPAATLVAAQLTGARLVPAPRAAKGTVSVVLGSGFTRLATPAEAAATARAPRTC